MWVIFGITLSMVVRLRRKQIQLLDEQHYDLPIILGNVKSKP